jgi:hypothetical protein
MKKLTAVSIRTEHGTSNHFIMLETERMQRCGVEDIKSRYTIAELSRMCNNHLAAFKHGDAVAIG